MSSTAYDFEKCPIFSPPYQGGDQEGVLQAFFKIVLQVEND
jgi:hypothetical protein